MGRNVVLNARAAISTYVLLWLPIGGICFLGILKFAFDLKADLFLSAVILFVFVWIRRLRIVADEDSLTYISLFGGKRRLEWKDITSARTEIGSRDRLSLGPTFGLVVDASDGVSSTRVVINMKVFRREDVVMLTGLLKDKMKGAPRLDIFGAKGDT